MTGYLLRGDCRQSMRTIPDNSVDAVVTDAPYELGFMGRAWDQSGVAYDVTVWAECLRVLKPGGHLLSFGGTRTYHRMACAIEDAGFEIRDMIEWVYGSGFPKSLDVSKAIDKAAGAKRTEQVGTSARHGGGRAFADGEGGFNTDKGVAVMAPATDAAREWSGWGTALKPAQEPICVARKPLVGTVVQNVLAHGTGAINIDGCRIEADAADREVMDKRSGAGFGTIQCVHAGRDEGERFKSHAQGRWPANLVHDGSDEVLAGFPAEAGGKWGEQGKDGKTGMFGVAVEGTRTNAFVGETGSAARFFYCAKASGAERASLCRICGDLALSKADQCGCVTADGKDDRKAHETVKPLALMEWLVRLVTPPGGRVLDPFCGTGSTLVAAKRLGFGWIGCELDPDYADMAEARLRATLL